MGRTYQNISIKNAKLLIQQGLVFHRNGMFQEASREYQKALEMFSKPSLDMVESPQSTGETISIHEEMVAKILHLLGLVSFQRGELEQSEDLISRAIKLGPPKALYWNHYGVTLRALQRLEDAETALLRATAIRANDADIWANLALVQLELEKLKEAKLSALKSLALNPQHVAAMKIRAKIERQQGHIPEAIRSFQQFLSIVPNDIESLLILTTLLVDRGCLAQAEAIYRKLSSMYPDKPELHLEIGHLCRDRGDVRQAHTEYSIAVRTAPQHSTWWMHELGLCEQVFESSEQIHEYLVDLEHSLDEGLRSPPYWTGNMH